MIPDRNGFHPDNDEFDSELSVDAALDGAFRRFDRVMRGEALRQECESILGHVAARDINNAATWAHFGPEYEAHAERARERAGYGEAQMAADPR